MEYGASRIPEGLVPLVETGREQQYSECLVKSKMRECHLIGNILVSFQPGLSHALALKKKFVCFSQFLCVSLGRNIK
jgi:hypothetical protein